MDTSVNSPIDKAATISKWVKYTSNAALKKGQAVCYNWDYTGDGADESEPRRYNEVETPTTANAQHFAGVASRAYSAKSGGQFIEIYVPGSICEIVLGVANTTVIGTGILTFDVTAAYVGEFRYAGLPGEGSAQPLQSVTLDGTNLRCLAKLQTGSPSGGVEVVACATPGPTCMVGGSSLITGGAPGGACDITLADGTIPGLRKRFVQITPELTTDSIVIAVTSGSTDDIDDVNLGTVTFTHGANTIDTEVTLEWNASWMVVGQTNAEPLLS